MAEQTVAVYPKLGDRKSAAPKIRIAIIGAAGVGKSTLCNLLCKENKFKCNSGFEACTDRTQSVTFNHNIDDETLTFEVIDCPGFINKKIPNNMDKIKEFERNIANCWDALKYGVSAYFLLIPYQRLETKHIESIRFVKKYFNTNALNHITIIFTKSMGKSCDEIINEIEDEEMKELIESLRDAVNNRCISAECIKLGNIENTEKIRNDILESAYYAHKTNKMYTNNVMVEAVGNLRKEMENNYKPIYSDGYQRWESLKKWGAMLVMIGAVYWWFRFKREYIALQSKLAKHKEILLDIIKENNLENKLEIKYIGDHLVDLKKKIMDITTKLDEFRNENGALREKIENIEERLLEKDKNIKDLSDIIKENKLKYDEVIKYIQNDVDNMKKELMDITNDRDTKLDKLQNKIIELEQKMDIIKRDVKNKLEKRQSKL